jgi:hypothetical protein
VGPAAALPTAVFRSIVLGCWVILGNFFRGSSLCVSYRSFPWSSILIVLVMSLGSYSVSLFYL